MLTLLTRRRPRRSAARLCWAAAMIFANGGCDRDAPQAADGVPASTVRALAPANTPATIFGGALVEWWDAKLGVTATDGKVSAWTGQAQGVVLKPGPGGAPALESEAPYFGGQPVVRTSKQGATSLMAHLDRPLMPAGARPYVAVAYRARSRSYNSARIVQINEPSGKAGFGLYEEDNATRTVYAPEWPAKPTSYLQAGRLDQSDEVTLAELWIDVDGAHYARNGLEYPFDRTTAQPLSTGLSFVGIGDIDGGGQPSDASFAQVVMLSAPPSAAQRADYLAYVRTAWNLERCGDGRLAPGEQCDDNNMASGDGCSSTCRAEQTIEATPAAAFGASLVEWWDARAGVGTLQGRVSGWAGQVQGLVLRPTAWAPATWPGYALDGSDFARLPVVQCSHANAGTLSTTSERDLLAAGERAYVAIVYRVRVDHEGDTRIFELRSEGYTTGFSVYDQGGRTRYLYSPDWPARQAAFDANDGPSVLQMTRPALVETWMDVDGVHFAHNGVEVAQPLRETTPLPYAIRSVAIANIVDGWQPSDTSVAQMVIARGPTTAEQRSAYRAQVSAQWGITMGSGTSPMPNAPPAVAVQQARDAYESSSTKPGSLGAATGSLTATAGGRGYFVSYQNGAVYFTPETGAHVVYGPVHGTWTESGAESGAFGYPVSDTQRAADGEGYFTNFERGMIYWSPKTGARIPLLW